MKVVRHISSWPSKNYLHGNGRIWDLCYGVGPRNNQQNGAILQEPCHNSTAQSSTIVREAHVHEAAGYCPSDQQAILGEDPGRGYPHVRRCKTWLPRSFPAYDLRQSQLFHDKVQACRDSQISRSSFSSPFCKFSWPLNPQLWECLSGKVRCYGVPAHVEIGEQSECETSDFEGDSSPTSWELRNGHNGIVAQQSMSPDSGFVKLQEQVLESPLETIDLSKLKCKNLTSLHVCNVLRAQKDAELAWQFFVWAEQQQGFQHNSWTCNSMIQTFCTAKNFKAIPELLEFMQHAGFYLTRVAWSKLIKGLAHEKMYEEAIRIFNTSKSFGCRPNTVVYNCYLDVLVKAGHYDQIDAVFAEMQADGHIPTVYTYNILINGFGKAEKVEKAFKIYDEMKANGCLPNVVTYITLLGVLGIRSTSKNIQCFREIIECHFEPAVSTYDIASSWHTRDGVICSALDMFRQVKRSDFKSNASKYHYLMPLLCKEQDVDSALQILREMELQGCIPSTSMYRLIISSLGKAGRLDTAMELFMDLKQKGFIVDDVLYSAIIHELCTANNVEEALLLHKEMVAQGLAAGTTTCNMLINLLIKSGQVERAFEFFSQMKDCKPDNFTYTSLMSALCRDKRALASLNRAGITSEFLPTRAQAGLSLMQQMKEVTVPDATTYLTLLDMLCTDGRADDAHNLLLDMQINGIVPGCREYNRVLDLLGSSEQMNRAWKLFLQMTAFTKPNVITYSIMIKFLGRAGSFGKAYKLLDEMKCRGFAPNAHTYRLLITSLGKAGKLEEMYGVFETMKTDDCEPDTFTYNSLLHAFAKAGQVDKAYSLFEESIDKGCIPDVYSYNAILGGYFQANRANEALDLYAVMKDMGCTASPLTYNILFAGLSKAGLSDMAFRVFSEMKKQGLAPTYVSNRNHQGSLRHHFQSTSQQLAKNY